MNNFRIYLVLSKSNVSLLIVNIYLSINQIWHYFQLSFSKQFLSFLCKKGRIKIKSKWERKNVLNKANHCNTIKSIVQKNCFNKEQLNFCFKGFLQWRLLEKREQKVKIKFLESKQIKLDLQTSLLIIRFVNKHVSNVTNIIESQI